MASRQVPTQKKEPPRAQTATRAPNKKQQIKQALALQSAHIITSDFQMLSQPLDNGILLMDRTERKLKLVKSLGELLPQHQYTTEYGNVLERTSKHKVLLAGSIELDVTTDEARFDEVLQQLALDARAKTTTNAKMAAYDAYSNLGGTPESSPVPQRRAADLGPPLEGSFHGSVQETEASEEHSVQLEEAEVMGRLQALMERVGEMERWFTGVKAEAERERKMREQAVQRLGFMQQRVDHATKEIADLRKENLDLRVRLEELQVSQEEIKDMAARGYARPSLVGTTSLEQIRASQGNRADNNPLSVVASTFGLNNF